MDLSVENAAAYPLRKRGILATEPNPDDPRIRELGGGVVQYAVLLVESVERRVRIEAGSGKTSRGRGKWLSDQQRIFRESAALEKAGAAFTGGLAAGGPL